MSIAPQRQTLRFFGAGGAFSRRYGTTCSLLTLADGARWLIDCGRQAPDQIHAAGMRWHDFEGQIITHVHGDHVFGLEDFAFVRYFYSHGGVASTFESRRGPKLIAHSAVREEIWETLAPSLRYMRDERGAKVNATLATFFEVIDASAHEAPRANPWRHAEGFESGSLRITARESEHVPGKPSCSLEISISEDDDRIAWWSGDCTVDPDFLRAIEPRTSVFFHDSTFVDYPGQVHGFFALLERLPEAVRKKMVLMHHEDNIEEHRARVEAAGFRIALPGHVYDIVSGQRLA
ncbi:MAG: MBL fold metallo-hydrolase [Myxococcales bacterium]|nr:MBL fold metallo-hydrolase [Myxococcales bacterium]MCB9705095.1 MBL fold metallo-hydrolase [Myxococcales bacterium]